MGGVTERIEDYVREGVMVEVSGRETSTTGTYRGLGLGEEGNPCLVLEKAIDEPLVAYALGEVHAVRVIG